MVTISQLRKATQGILVIGLHPQIIQSILDFDYACGKKEGSVVAIIANNRSAIKFFFGSREILIPVFSSVKSVPKLLAERVTWMLNAQSGRRTLESTKQFFAQFPHAHGGHLFAENVPEMHALELISTYGQDKIIAGPSGVGLLVPGALKLGAIGGTDIAQIKVSHLGTPGSVAVVSTSGGMTNELIRGVTAYPKSISFGNEVAESAQGKRISFAISIGGDRFPVTGLKTVLRLAEEDSATQAIVYFGELGGTDEYEIVEMLEKKELTKPILCYVAGVIDEAFTERQQFGHAKALVTRADESARAKRKALRDAGAIVAETFPAFMAEIARLPQPPYTESVMGDDVTNRSASILSTRKIIDLESVPEPIVDGALAKPRAYALSHAILSALLGREISDETSALMEHIFELLIDHGGEVSGAVNTMITARAGKDLMSSLAAGILTIGPRFGGAVNEAASQWVEALATNAGASEFVEARTKSGKLLSGIGHRKYRVGIPDPRVEALSQFTSILKKHPHYDFAREVEKVTTAKNGKLILNVDGAMASLMLDMLAEKDGFTAEELRGLITSEFFNALFVIPRSIGFIAHFMEQKKNDEGLFRLPEQLLFTKK